MSRELVVLGTASQAPTRERNHNGYLLRWDDLGLLFDPGEGTQRQMLLAGVRSSQITHVVLTHEHGDHTLGLPGVLQRMALDQRHGPVTVIHPAHSSTYVTRLLALAQVGGRVAVDTRPLTGPSAVALRPGLTLTAEPLDHRVPTLGYRLEAEARPRMDPEALERAGLSGPIVGRLLDDGQVTVDGRVVRLEEMSHLVAGQRFAFVMDTRLCDGVATLLDGADMAVVEATFTDEDAGLAEAHGHLTAGQAGRAAAAARVGCLVLTHFSRRYDRPEVFTAQAGAHHQHVIAAVDLMRIPLRRHTLPA